MRSRTTILKEIRILQPALNVALGSAILLPVVNRLIATNRLGGMPDFWLSLATFALFASILFTVALSWGAELQHRTVGLLLSQSRSRGSVWREKLVVLAAALAVVGFVYAVTAHLAQPLIPKPVWMDRNPKVDGEWTAVLFVVCALFSGGFWTLLARSTIGGAVFCAIIPLLLGALLSNLVDWLGGKELVAHGNAMPLLLAGAAAYCGLSLWLSWRIFARFEQRDTVPGLGDWPWTNRAERAGAAEQEQDPAPAVRVGRGWLAPRAGEGAGNLFRKEIRLLKPVLLLALVFAVSWAGLFALSLAAPGRKELLQDFQAVLLVAYLPVCLLLCGCVPLGEEKALGVQGWHLTLPISRWRQWGTKLAVAGASAVLLGMVLPWTACAVFLGAGRWMQDEIWPIPVFSTLVFVAAFWMITIVGSTVRAVLGAVSGSVLLGLSIGLGTWSGHQLEQWAMAPISWLMAQFQWAPHAMKGDWLSTGLFMMAVLLGLLLLGMSFRNFRGEVSQRSAVKQSLAALGTAFAVMLIVNAGSGAAWRTSELSLRELSAAFSALNLRPDLSSGQTVVVGRERLEATGMLSDRTLRWLRHAKFSMSFSSSDREGRSFQLFYNVSFAKGGQPFQIPDRVVLRPITTSPAGPGAGNTSAPN